MTTRIIQGDCIEELRKLPEASVHCCVTSPPYWGLRDYGITPTIWGGDPACEHDFADESVPTEIGKGNWAQGVNGRGELQPGGVDAKREPVRSIATRGFCRCGAWRGAFGLEPTPALYVEHAVMVFREARRVLRDDGTLWLNLGDSYATGAGKASSPGGGMQGERFKESGSSGYRGAHDISGKHAENASIPNFQPNRMPQEGLKPKDLCEIPSDVVRALRADGWWLRSRIPWIKRNAMPESTKDRPTTAVEYVFLLSKSERYYYDGEAVAVKQSDHERTRRLAEQTRGLDTKFNLQRDKAHGQVKPGENGCARSTKARQDLAVKGTRARRNSDWFFESWQGMLQDDAGDPLALIVNPRPFKEAHFATFPPSLIEPCILAGAPLACCEACGAPYKARVVAKGGTIGKGWHDHTEDLQNGHRVVDQASHHGRHGTELYTREFQGYFASCDCNAETKPGVVLDPFGGAGTTGLVADRLQRDGVLIELNPEYAAMAEKRIHADGPLFSSVTA